MMATRHIEFVNVVLWDSVAAENLISTLKMAHFLIMDAKLRQKQSSFDVSYFSTYMGGWVPV